MFDITLRKSSFSVYKNIPITTSVLYWPNPLIYYCICNEWSRFWRVDNTVKQPIDFTVILLPPDISASFKSVLCFKMLRSAVENILLNLTQIVHSYWIARNIYFLPVSFCVIWTIGQISILEILLNFSHDMYICCFYYVYMLPVL